MTNAEGVVLCSKAPGQLVATPKDDDLVPDGKTVSLSRSIWSIDMSFRVQLKARLCVASPEWPRISSRCAMSTDVVYLHVKEFSAS